MQNRKHVIRFMILVTVLLVVCSLGGASAKAGRLIALGRNDDGQCHVPMGNDYVAISARYKHSLALRADGRIFGWGQNIHGQSNPPAGYDYIAIAAGTDHNLALRADGSVLAWGRNENGECAAGQIKDAIAIAAGIGHSVALIEPSGDAPAADAGHDIIAAPNQEVILDASDSSDPDGMIIEYTWKRLPDNVVIYTGPLPRYTTRALGRAEELIELTVTDNDLLQSTDTVLIINHLFERPTE